MDALFSFLTSLLEIFGPILALVLGPMILAVVYRLFNRLGLDTDALNRDALQTAISNAALEAVRQAGGPGKALRIDNMHLGPAVKQALEGAPDAIKHFGIKPEEVEKRVLAKATAIVQATPTIDVPASTTGGAVERYSEIDKALGKLLKSGN